MGIRVSIESSPVWDSYFELGEMDVFTCYSYNYLYIQLLSHFSFTGSFLLENGNTGARLNYLQSVHQPIRPVAHTCHGQRRSEGHPSAPVLPAETSSPSPLCTSRVSSSTSNGTDASNIHLQLHAKIPIIRSIMLMSRPHHPVKRPPPTPQHTSPIVTTLNTPPTSSSAHPSTSRSPGPQPPSPYRPAGGSPAPPYCGSPP